MINWALVKNPLNWFTVVLMVVIAMFGLHQASKLAVANSSSN